MSWGQILVGDMKELRIAPEYGCYPLWVVRSDGGLENIEAYALPIPRELAESVEDWGDRFERTLNSDYPPESGFASEAEASAFKNEGNILAQRLQEILSNEFVMDVRLNSVSVKKA